MLERKEREESQVGSLKADGVCGGGVHEGSATEKGCGRRRDWAKAKVKLRRWPEKALANQGAVE